MSNLEKRSIWVSVLFSILTFGMYSSYWMIQLTDETHELLGRRTIASGGMGFIYAVCTFGLYFFYWVYKIMEEMNLAKAARGMQYDSNLPIFSLLLAIFGFGFIPVILLQSSVNDAIAHDFGEYEN